MRLAASCIAWQPEEMDEALSLLAGAGFAGVEVAPTMIAGARPYENLAGAAAFAGRAAGFGLAVCSLQSIWYGQAGGIFGPEREALLAYTQGAIRFAQAAGAENLVFGCPKNRVRPAGASEEEVLPFFTQLGAYAAAHGCTLALEPNPPIYGTNFLNTTPEALAYAERVGSPGCRVNLDVGTMVQNGEDAALLRGRVAQLSHVHISEPNLVPIVERPLHRQLATVLREEGYTGFVSIEMGRAPLAVLGAAAAYVAEVFG